MEPAPELKEVPEGASLSEATEVIVFNYNLYHQTALQLHTLQLWITTQQQVYK